MSGLQNLHLMPIPLAFTAGIFPVVFYMLLDRLPPIWPSSKKAMMIGPKQPQDITSFECPYSYIRQIYGKYHWAPFIHKLSPSLKDTNPRKYKWILEVMDTIHLCLMMVDDVGRSLQSRITLLTQLDIRQQRFSERQASSTSSLRAIGNSKQGILPGDTGPKRDSETMAKSCAIFDAEPGRNPARPGSISHLAP